MKNLPESDESSQAAKLPVVVIRVDHGDFQCSPKPEI